MDQAGSPSRQIPLPAPYRECCLEYAREIKCTVFYADTSKIRGQIQGRRKDIPIRTSALAVGLEKQIEKRLEVKLISNITVLYGKLGLLQK